MATHWRCTAHCLHGDALLGLHGDALAPHEVCMAMRVSCLHGDALATHEACRATVGKPRGLRVASSGTATWWVTQGARAGLWIGAPADGVQRLRHRGAHLHSRAATCAGLQGTTQVAAARGRVV